MRSRLCGGTTIVAATLVLLFVIATTGFTYEQIGRRHDRQSYPQVGYSVDIGGRSLNLYCSGTGSPTVVFEAGGTGGGYSWALVQPQTANTTRACWYDRAGEGWSDPPPKPRSSASVVADLHELLNRAGVNPPYVLVGHSIGGEYVRVYTAKFPAEIVGLVLVDSSVPDQQEPASMKGSFARMSPMRRRMFCTTLPVLSRFGVLRLVNVRSHIPMPALAPENVADINRVFRTHPLTIATSAQQICAATGNGRFAEHGGTGNPELDGAARASGTLGNRPLIVLTAGLPFVFSDSDAAREAISFHDVWVHQLQAKLAQLSTRGRQIVVPNSGHSIPYDAPEALVKAVEEVVRTARAGNKDQSAGR